MSISNYLWAIRRRLWLPIAAPLLAAAVTAGFLYIQPESYQALATVIVPSLSVKGYSTSAVTQYVSSFKDVLTSAPVVAQVSQDTGASKKDLVAGLSATTNTASSNVILVTFTGRRRSQVVAVAQAAAIDSLDALLRPQQQKGQLEETASQTALDTATQAVSQFALLSGHLFPDVDYKIKSSEVSALEVQLLQAKLANDKARVRGLTPIVNARIAALKVLAADVIQYQALVQARTGAESAHTRAVIDLNSVNAEVASDHAVGSVTVSFLGHVSRLPVILRFSAVAAAVALLLALGLVILLEFVRPTPLPVPYSSPFSIPSSMKDRVSGSTSPFRSTIKALSRSGGPPSSAPEVRTPPSEVRTPPSNGST